MLAVERLMAGIRNYKAAFSDVLTSFKFLKSKNHSVEQGKPAMIKT